MTDLSIFGGDVVWEPTPESVERSHLRQFMVQHSIGSYAELQQRSTQEIAWFTDAVLKYLDIQFQRPYSQVVDLSPGIQRPNWCVGGQLNIVRNCLDKWAASPETRDRKALVWEGEEGATRSLTYSELSSEVNRCANALRSLGLGKGDAIGLHMPMTPEICIALLAIAKIGGVILPLFSGYGAVGHCVSPVRCERQSVVHCRWLVSPWPGCSSEARRRPGDQGCAFLETPHCPETLQQCGVDAARTGLLVA